MTKTIEDDSRVIVTLVNAGDGISEVWLRMHESEKKIKILAPIYRTIDPDASHSSINQMLGYLRGNLLKTKPCIINNTCFAANIYEGLNLPFLSPFINIRIKAEYLLNIAEHPEHYLNIEPKLDDKLEFGITHEHRRPIYRAKIDDIYIHFSHVHTREDAERAIQDWIRRCKRVDLDNLVVILDDMQSEVSMQEYSRFEKLKCKKLLMSRKLYENNKLKYPEVNPFMYGDAGLRRLDIPWEHYFDLLGWLND